MRSRCAFRFALRYRYFRGSVCVVGGRDRVRFHRRWSLIGVSAGRIGFVRLCYPLRGVCSVAAWFSSLSALSIRVGVLCSVRRGLVGFALGFVAGSALVFRVLRGRCERTALRDVWKIRGNQFALVS